MIDSVKGIPEGFRARFARLREDVIWAWEDSPFNRRSGKSDSREEADP